MALIPFSILTLFSAARLFEAVWFFSAEDVLVDWKTLLLFMMCLLLSLLPLVVLLSCWAAYYESLESNLKRGLRPPRMVP